MIDIKEVKRYLKSKGASGQDSLIEEICKELEAKITPRIIQGEFSIKKTKDGYLIGGTETAFKGKLIEKTLRDCDRIILFVITLTTISDNMLREYSAADMAKAVILNASMTAYIEAFADAYQFGLKDRLEKSGKDITRRISCGYGDFDIAYQSFIINLLKADKYLGVFCNESNMLTPIKSITALIGVKEKSNQGEADKASGCSGCGLNCCYKKEEK